MFFPLRALLVRVRRLAIKRSGSLLTRRFGDNLRIEQSAKVLKGVSYVFVPNSQRSRGKVLYSNKKACKFTKKN